MQHVLRLSLTALAAAAFVFVAGLASAQTPAPSPKQIKLTEPQVTGFISAHKDMAEAFDKVPSEKSDAAIDAQLDSVAKRFGFKDHKEYEEVAANVIMVFIAIDPQTKAFTDPPTLTKQKLEEAKVDKSLSDEDRKQVLEDLAEELKVVQPIIHPSNVDLVKKFYDKIEPLLQ